MSGRPKIYYTSDICSASGCEKKRAKNGLCNMHAARMRRHGHLEPTRRTMGSGAITEAGYVSITQNGNRVYEHILVAENALGRPLPDKAQVHHVNGNPTDNRPTNLVICPDDAFHKLLHKRQRALDISGNADYRSCHFCHQYDHPNNLAFRGEGHASFHRECERAYNRQRYLRKKEDRVAG